MLQAPIVLWVGRVSYGMYLWHYLWLYLAVKSGLLDGLPDGLEVLATVAFVSLGTAATAALSGISLRGASWGAGSPPREAKSRPLNLVGVS